MNGPGKSGDECGSSPHGWTLDTLEEYLTSKINSLDKFTAAESRASKEAVSAALAAVKEQSNHAMMAAEKAILKSDTATEKRFDSVNEFRQTLSDQAADFLQRKEYEANHKAMVEKVVGIESRVTRFESSVQGKNEGISLSWGVFLGVTTAAAVISGALGLTIASRNTAPMVYLPSTQVSPPAIPMR